MTRDPVWDAMKAISQERAAERRADPWHHAKHTRQMGSRAQVRS
jgi:hypothetical protein